MRLRAITSTGNATELIVAGGMARMGRDASCEVAFDPVAYPQVSSLHARLDQTSSGLVLTPLSRSNKTLRNDEPIDGPTPVRPGDRIRLGFSGPTVEVLPEGSRAKLARQAAAAAEAEVPVAVVPVVGLAGDAAATAQADPQHLGLLRGTQAAERMEVGAGGVIGRERGRVQFLLDHPHVSREHAELQVKGSRVQLADLGSANGTYVNARRINRAVTLKRGDRIDIGPFSLEFDGAALVSRSRSNNIELAARRLTRTVKDRATGKPLTLLNDLSLIIRPREFVCLLGPSGSGKSTLLAMLSGRNPPDRGAVLVNGQDLYANFAALKQDIAVVPQKDVLHEGLATGAALRYTAQLRLPPDTARREIENSVSDILGVVGLAKRRHTLIRHLSGGQVKRASLANELIARPSLIFLDEVTSGLDEQTDAEMMELFREVADSGKTVVCVTHSLANVEANCHLVVVLTEGGRLAFVGTPDEAKMYFDMARLGQVYRKLAERPAEEWQARFKASPLYVRYVRERLAGQEADDDSARKHEAPARLQANPFRQAWVLTRRYVSIWRGDPQALLTMLGQSVLVALLLGLVFGRLEDVEHPAERAQRSLNLLFLVNVACFWFGCNNAAKELVKERVIYTRERDFNLRLDSYYISKLVVLIFIALLQVALLFGIIHAWCGPPGPPEWQAATLAVVAVAGTTLGLLLSAFARTEEVAAALVPIAVMPQIILAGVIAPLTGVAKALATVGVTVYLAERALEALLPEDNLTVLGLSQPEYGLHVGVVAVHVALFAVLTLGVLWHRSRTKFGG